jgi:hypothetical protein
LADELAEPLGDIEEVLGLELFGDVADQSPVDVGQVAQEEAFGAGQAVMRDVLRERHRLFVEVPGDRLRCDVVVGGPRMDDPVGIEQVIRPIPKGFGVLKLVEGLDPLLVLDPCGL